MKLPFTVRDRAIQTNFDKMAAGIAFERVRTGRVQLTFTGSDTSAIVTVPHGLGMTPTAVLVSNQFIVATVDVVGYSANFTATDFLAVGRSLSGPWTGSLFHFWLAAA